MSGEYRALSAEGFAAPAAAPDPGPVTMLDWRPIALLRVDPSYQRTIGQKGAATIRKIVAEFDWSKFAPVIVAPIAGGLYAIVDGQHRTTAALARGLETVPCCIALLDRASQAAAFAAINGQVTAMHATQLFHAKVAAGDPDATALAKICAAAGVRILRSPRAAAQMKRGDTIAAGALQALSARENPERLTLALKCVVQTRDGNPGYLRAPVLRAFMDLFATHPDFAADEGALLDAVDGFDFASAWGESVGRVSGGVKISDAFYARLASHLKRTLLATPQRSAAA